MDLFDEVAKQFGNVLTENAGLSRFGSGAKVQQDAASWEAYTSSTMEHWVQSGCVFKENPNEVPPNNFWTPGSDNDDASSFDEGAEVGSWTLASSSNTSATMSSMFSLLMLRSRQPGVPP